MRRRSNPTQDNEFFVVLCENCKNSATYDIFAIEYEQTSVFYLQFFASSLCSNIQTVLSFLSSTVQLKTLQ